MAQAVFDCDDIRKEIFSYCLPQYPIVTKEMVLKRLKRLEPFSYSQPKTPHWLVLHELKKFFYEHQYDERYEAFFRACDIFEEPCDDMWINGEFFEGSIEVQYGFYNF